MRARVTSNSTSEMTSFFMWREHPKVLGQEPIPRMYDGVVENYAENGRKRGRGKVVSRQDR